MLFDHFFLGFFGSGKNLFILPFQLLKLFSTYCLGFGFLRFLGNRGFGFCLFLRGFKGFLQFFFFHTFKRFMVTQLAFKGARTPTFLGFQIKTFTHMPVYFSSGFFISFLAITLSISLEIILNSFTNRDNTAFLFSSSSSTT